MKSFLLSGNSLSDLNIKRVMGASIKKINDEVFFASDPVVKVNKGDIVDLCTRSGKNRRKRARICTHKGIDDSLHEMLIVHTNDTYVRPHKHLGKIESFHVIDGRADIVLFDDGGCLAEVIHMGDYVSGLSFYYRIAAPYFHTLLILSEVLVFHEVTNGPFRSEDTIFAPWAPDESDSSAQKVYLRNLNIQLDNFLPKAEKDI